MKITKTQVLENLETIKQYIAEAEQKKKEEKVVGLSIKNRWAGDIIFQSTKTTYKEAVNECVAEANKGGTRANLTGADLTGADLTGADLTGADLTGADLTACLFYLGYSNKNFEALCKAIKTIKWNGNTGADFIK